MINEEEFRIIENLGCMKVALVNIENVMSTHAARNAHSKSIRDDLSKVRHYLKAAVESQQYAAEEILSEGE